MKVLRLLQALIATLCAFQIASCSIISVDSLETIDHVEAILGASRGPLSALSYYHQAKIDNKSKVFHSLANLVRIAHEICAIINHKDESSYSLGIRAAWITFDAINFYNNLFAQNKKADADAIELSAHDKKVIDRLVENLQLFLLPALESITSVYQALAPEQTVKSRANRRQAQAFCSLARAISIFLNNRQSKAAIVLLLAALSETMVVVNKNVQKSSVLNSQNRQQSQQQDEHCQAATTDQRNETLAREIQAINQQYDQEAQQLIAALNAETTQRREQNVRNAAQATQTAEEHLRRLDATHEQQRAATLEAQREQLRTRNEELARQEEDLNRRAAAIPVRHEQATQEVMARYEASRDRIIAQQDEQLRIVNEFLDRNPTALEMDNLNQLLAENVTTEELQAFVNNQGANL